MKKKAVIIACCCERETVELAGCFAEEEKLRRGEHAFVAVGHRIHEALARVELAADPRAGDQVAGRRLGLELELLGDLARHRHAAELADERGQHRAQGR